MSSVGDEQAAFLGEFVDDPALAGIDPADRGGRVLRQAFVAGQVAGIHVEDAAQRQRGKDQPQRDEPRKMPPRTMPMNRSTALPPAFDPRTIQTRARVKTLAGRKWRRGRAFAPSQSGRAGAPRSLHPRRPVPTRPCTIASAIRARQSGSISRLKSRADDRKPSSSRTDGMSGDFSTEKPAGLARVAVHPDLCRLDRRDQRPRPAGRCAARFRCAPCPSAPRPPHRPARSGRPRPEGRRGHAVRPARPRPRRVASSARV